MVKPFHQRKRIYLFRFAVLALIPLLFIVQPIESPFWWEEFLEVSGVFLMVICILGRMWSSLYIGGRKNHELVIDGPYSLCRHPLYLFSFIGAVGFGLMFGTLTLGVIFGSVAFVGLRATAKKEQTYLLHEFGDAYKHQMRRVPMLIPRSLKITSPENVQCKHSALRANFYDSLGWMSSFFVVGIVETLRESFNSFVIHAL